MQKIFNNKIGLLTLVLTLMSNSIFAQDPGGIEDDPGAAAPIDQWIPLMIIIGIAIVFFYLNRKKAIAN